MAVKPSAKLWTIKEQIFEDPITGLTLQFVVTPGSSSPYRLMICSADGETNRELLFDENGVSSGSQTNLTSKPRLNWLRQVK